MNDDISNLSKRELEELQNKLDARWETLFKEETLFKKIQEAKEDGYREILSYNNQIDIRLYVKSVDNLEFRVIFPQRICGRQSWVFEDFRLCNVGDSIYSSFEAEKNLACWIDRKILNFVKNMVCKNDKKIP